MEEVDKPPQDLRGLERGSTIRVRQHFVETIKMINPGIEQELHRHLALLPAAQQRQVLDYARILSITQPQGVKGSSLLAFAGTIPAEELAQMQTAIEADCEQVDAHGW